MFATGNSVIVYYLYLLIRITLGSSNNFNDIKRPRTKRHLTIKINN